jgi:hypothetical protein
VVPLLLIGQGFSVGGRARHGGDHSRVREKRLGSEPTRLENGKRTAFAAGGTPKEVQEMLGHADTRLTLAIYTDVLAGLQEATADRIDAMIAAADGCSHRSRVRLRPETRRDSARHAGRHRQNHPIGSPEVASVQAVSA